jgi:hypothetical protein
VLETGEGLKRVSFRGAHFRAVENCYPLTKYATSPRRPAENLRTLGCEWKKNSHYNQTV